MNWKIWNDNFCKYLKKKWPHGSISANWKRRERRRVMTRYHRRFEMKCNLQLFYYCYSILVPFCAKMKRRVCFGNGPNGIDCCRGQILTCRVVRMCIDALSRVTLCGTMPTPGMEHWMWNLSNTCAIQRWWKIFKKWKLPWHIGTIFWQKVKNHYCFGMVRFVMYNVHQKNRHKSSWRGRYNQEQF